RPRRARSGAGDPHGRGGARHRRHRCRLRRARHTAAPSRETGTARMNGPADLLSFLVRRGETIAVAESLTGGLIGATLTSVPGSSAAFVGGVVSYATDLKERLLGVPGDLLAREGAVHPAVAAAMAR